MRMVEQNVDKFQRVEKIIKKKSLLVGICFSGNVIALCVGSDERINKFVMATLNLKKSKRNNFAGGIGCENFIRC